MTQLLVVNGEEENNFMVACANMHKALCKCDSLKKEGIFEPQNVDEAKKQIVLKTMKEAVLPHLESKMKNSCLPAKAKEKEAKIFEFVKKNIDKRPFEVLRTAAVMSGTPQVFSKLALTKEFVKDFEEKGELKEDLGKDLQVGFLSGLLGSISSITGSSTQCGALGSLFQTKACKQKQDAAAAAMTGANAAANQAYSNNDAYVKSLQEQLVQAQQRTAADTSTSGFTKYLPYIAIGGLVLFVLPKMMKK